jgi:hypothetical protein
MPRKNEAPRPAPQPAPSAEALSQQNHALTQASLTLFGDAARMEIVDPRALCLLKRNARFFKKEAFRQLVENVRRDKRLSSVPLCRALADGRREILSGNHRVKAAVEAGLPLILVLTITQDLSQSERIAVQLSHTALVGQDDAGILASLWADIEDLQARLYAGLSSDALQELEDVKLVSLSTPAVATKSVAFVFTEYERALMDEVLDELGRVHAAASFLFPAEQFNEFFTLVQAVKRKMNIKNGSMAMVRIIEILSEHLARLPADPPPPERRPGEEG